MASDDVIDPSKMEALPEEALDVVGEPPTTENAEPGTGSAPAPEAIGQEKPHSNVKIIIYAVIALLVVVAVVVVALSYRTKPAGVTTSSTLLTTTIGHNGTVVLAPGAVSSCGVIRKPGTYYLTQGFSVGLNSSPCLAVYSSNVKFDGHGYSIEGSGPYIITANPTYGIYAANLTNVTIENLSVSQFSYGVFFSGMYGSKALRVKATNATVSDFYLYRSTNSTLGYDTASGAESAFGGIYLSGGGFNNVSNSEIQSNAYYGLYLNSSNNTFFRNTFASNPVDLVCSANANGRKSNAFGNSSCQVNQYCNFASCSSQNLPYSVQNTQLQKAINSCGSIVSHGVYEAGSSLSLSNYENISNPASKKDACITINSPDVTLNCNNRTIGNAYYGVLEQGLYNTSIENCVFENDSYGLYLKNTIGASLTNLQAQGGIYGIYLNNATGTVLTKVQAQDNTFGLYLQGASGSSIYNMNMYNNTYGVYVNGAGANGYYSGSTKGNLKADLYCSANSYNSTGNFYKPIACGSSDCAWATSCTKILNPPIPLTPIFGCGTIQAAGNYTLKSSLLNPTRTGTCLTIKANNVSLDCNNEIIQGGGQAVGTGVSLQGVSNFRLDNCNLRDFQYAVSAANASYLQLQNLNISTVGSGIYAKGAFFSTVSNVSVNTFSNYGFYFNRTNSTVIANDSVRDGINGASAYSFSNFYNNIVLNNSVDNVNPYGFVFQSARGNKVSGNSATGTAVAGYSCDPASSGLFSQGSYVNYGVGKVGCVWMIEVNPSVSQTCGAIYSSAIVQLSQDMLYTFGNACYTVGTTQTVVNGTSNRTTVNNTIINCGGHTVVSDSGGTFVSASTNAGGVVLENCYIKNFTTAMYIQGPGATVINNTISNVKNGVYINGGSNAKIQNNQITNSSYGIYVGNARFGSILQNNITNTNTSIQLVGTSGEMVTGNRVNNGGYGLYLTNSSVGLFKSNYLLNQSKAGAFCTSSAGGANSINRDSGGNVCSSNSGCTWMSSSPLCKAG